jgi:cell division protein FtsA
MACLVEDESDLGVTCIDMGGGTTSIAAFADGGLIYADLLPIGGDHVTSDIARGLSTPSSYAERIKTLYGSALPSLSDDREMISVPYVGEKSDEAVNKIPRSMLTGIIQPRIEEILEMVRARLDQIGYSEVAGKRLVITGGASQLNGIRELSQRVLGKQVRLGTPHSLAGMPDMAHSAPFSTCVGLIYYARSPLATRQNVPEWNMAASKSGYFVRVGQWIRENF